MPFASITRASLEILNQNLRARGVAPGALLPARGNAAAAADPGFGVCEDLLRVLPFVNVTEAAVARVYQVQVSSAQDVLYDPARKRRGGLAEIIARVRPGDDGLGASADVVVTASQVIRGLVNELEELGVTPDFRYCPLTRKQQLYYFGVP